MADLIGLNGTNVCLAVLTNCLQYCTILLWNEFTILHKKIEIAATTSIFKKYAVSVYT